MKVKPQLEWELEGMTTTIVAENTVVKTKHYGEIATRHMYIPFIIVETRVGDNVSYKVSIDWGERRLTSAMKDIIRTAVDAQIFHLKKR